MSPAGRYLQQTVDDGVINRVEALSRLVDLVKRVQFRPSREMLHSGMVARAEVDLIGLGERFPGPPREIVRVAGAKPHNGQCHIITAFQLTNVLVDSAT